ncbi:MAG: SUMF1/EgtB/PvdO family nonheme iron enzyme [Clostridia bacterium]|nr:SUMF1/EgtB/PvdO family nonheme iron enzyme [Clostridia bacterium]
MGDENGRDTKPVHSVTLNDFYIEQTQVRQSLWTAVMQHNPAHFHGDDLPMESVTLSDCHAFIAWLNQLTGLRFRLPTEAEWEYAARGGQYSHGYAYSGSDDIDDVAWYDNVDRPQPVAQKKPNELGLYDMSGNICEWCEDIYEAYTDAPQHNPHGAESGAYHLARGGGWNRGGHMCKVYDRGNYRPEYASNAVGLRLVMDLLTDMDIASTF